MSLPLRHPPATGAPDDRQFDGNARSRLSQRSHSRPRAGPAARLLIEATREHERALLEPFGEHNAAALVGALRRLIDRNR